VPVAHVNGTRLYHRTTGTGPDVVLAHGLGANHAFWYPAVAPELARDHSVTVYDLRGHGRSEMPDSGYLVRVMAHDLAGLLDALGISRAHLIGHSWGGLVALELALRRPERVASVVAADCRLSFKRGGQVDHRMLERLARGRQRPATSRPAPGAFAPFGGWGAGRRSGQRWLQLLERTSADRELRSGGSIAPARLRKLEPPVLAIYGARSFALPSGRLLTRTAPRCRLVVIPRVGHFHPAVTPGEFVAAVRGFLAEPPPWSKRARA
jgi:pimeloyl-ACP methyl ester carboxylesterase